MSQTSQDPTQDSTHDHVRQLLRRAAEHPLGTDFLLHGALDAVAATFQVHAFVVDAVRDAARPPVVQTVADPVFARSDVAM